MTGLTINDFSDVTRALQMMRDELTILGVKELRTPEGVDRAMENATGTMLLVFNSVCGCAADSARPGLGLALQDPVVPAALYSVFAGQDKEATARARQYISDQPPSSPSVALFKDGQLVYIMHRYMIEDRSPAEIAHDLVAAFNTHCDGKGPSVPPDVLSNSPTARMC